MPGILRFRVPANENIRKEMGSNPNLSNVEKFNTPLSINEMNEFYDWAKSKYGNEDEILRQMGSYDLQGAWRAMKSGQIKEDPATGHLPDTYKKPNHITFSNESIYSNEKTPGGQWSQTDGKWQYAPSEYTKKLHGEKAIQSYFQKYEPDSILINKTK